MRHGPWIIVCLTAALMFPAQSQADWLTHVGRYLGAGWGDGYHAPPRLDGPHFYRHHHRHRHPTWHSFGRYTWPVDAWSVTPDPYGRRWQTSPRVPAYPTR